MLSPKTLERVSGSYRRGYYDGHAKRPNVGAEVPADQIKPFANFDYKEGYEAGANDRKFADLQAGVKA